MALSITPTGINVIHDETAGLQNASTTAAPEDADNDIALAALPLAFASRLSALNAGTPIGAALSGFNGSNTGQEVFTISGGAVTDIAFTDGNGTALNGLDSGLDTLAGNNILLYSDTNNNIVLGREGGAGGDIVFAIYLEETGAPVTGGKMWVVQYEALQHDDPNNHDDPDVLDLANKLFVASTQDLTFSLANAPSGQNLFLMFTVANPNTVNDNGVIRITDPTIIATGKDPANQSTGVNISTGDTINTSQAGGPTTFGTNSQMITEQEGIRFSFVTGARQNVTIPNLDQTEADVEANADFTAFFGTSTAIFDVVQLQSGKSAQVKITAFSSDNVNEAGNNFVDGYSDDAVVAISSVTVTDANGAPVAVNISISGGVAFITGVKAGHKITYTTTSDHNRVLIENGAALNATGNTHADFDIGGFRLIQVSTATLEVGTKVIFEDDGPSISTGGTEPTLTVDESALGTDATVDFSGNFTSAFGTDGAGTLGYALGISAGSTGLVDTATNEAVVLSLVSGTVEGRTAVSSNLVFVVSVDSSGNVTLDQKRAVVHDDPADPDEATSPATLSADNLVTLTATVTDGDGDSASATLNIGQNLNFEDDGPSITTGGTEATLTVDETVLATNDTKSFANNFTSAFGADGAGTLGFALGINVGSTGLVDTATNQAVVLSLVGGQVQGRTAVSNDLVFTVSVNSSTGEVTLDQLRAVVHANTSDPDDSKSLASDNLVTLTATITDKDGDSQAATLNIGQNLNFEDDGPSITTTGTEPTLTVDETVLATNDTKSFASNFTSAFGADGAGTLSYALGINAGGTGLVDTLTGQAVVLSLVGGQVQGRTATSNALVFTVSVDSAGNVTLDQQRAVVHPNVNDPDDSKSLASDSLVTLTATITDKDGDSQSASLNIGQNLNFEDDGPTLNFGNLIGPVTITPQFGFWSGAAGADQPGDLGITLDSFTIVRPNGTSVAGSSFTFNELAGSPNAAGDYLYAGSLTADFDNNPATADQTVDFNFTAFANGRYSFDLVQSFGTTTVTLSSANGQLGAGGPDPVQTLSIESNGDGVLNAADEQVVFFGVVPTTAPGTILTDAVLLGQPDRTEAQIEAANLAFISNQNMNVSTSGIGIANNNLEGNNTAGIQQTGDESFVVNPETLLTRVKVFIDNSLQGYNPATEELYYTIYFEDGSTSGPTKVQAGDLSAEPKGLTSFLIQSTPGGLQIDAVQLTMGKGAVKIPVIEFVKQTVTLASDIQLDFTATLTDADGDKATSSFATDLFNNELPTAPFDYLFAGTAGDLDAFNIDLAATQDSYQVTGFDTPNDTLVLLGDATNVAIDNSGVDSIVSITESGGGLTTVTVVGVDLQATNVVEIV